MGQCCCWEGRETPEKGFHSWDWELGTGNWEMGLGDGRWVLGLELELRLGSGNWKLGVGTATVSSPPRALTAL